MNEPYNFNFKLVGKLLEINNKAAGHYREGLFLQLAFSNSSIIVYYLNFDPHC